ncbi:MAG: DNA primase, partial [Chitinophagaceae bacterium]|nr:DNA primase [Anaerolineae bacterium]
SWRCFGACAEGGDIFAFAMKQNGWNFSEAIEALGAMAGVEVKKETPQQRQRSETLDKLRGLIQTAAEIYHQHLVEGKTDDAKSTLYYVQTKRGLSDEIIRQFQIGYAPPGWKNMLDELTHLGYSEAEILDAGIATKNDEGRVYDRFRNRLMIPIRDDRGRVIGFGARALAPDDNPKYLNSPQTPLFDKSRVLFGLDMAKNAIRDGEMAVIVEGYMDVIQAHQAGFTNVVAQMGTAMTEAQIKTLTPRYAKKIILALDSDAAGQSATRRSLETAQQTLESDYAGRLSVDIRVLQIPNAKDPDDLIRETPEQWRDLVNNALPVADFVIQMEMVSLPQNPSVQEREALARRILPILAASENNLYQHDNIQKLSMRLRIPERDLLAWAQEQAAKVVRPAQHDSKARTHDQMEPPSVNYEVIEPPDFVDDEEGYTVTKPSRSPGTAVRNADVSLEAHCLRLLLQKPELYYQVNRKFRELAGDHAGLRQGPLSDLGVDDFSRGDYQAIIHTLILAQQQSEMEAMDYLNENLDPVLLQEIQTLLVSEEKAVHDKVGQRFQSDFSHVLWKNYERRILPSLNPGLEVIDKALRLRLARLKRDIDEFSFMQQDSQVADASSVVQLGMQVVLSRQARHLLDTELARQFKSLT